MSRLLLRLALVALAVTPSFAATVVVGGCVKTLANYQTIGAAINSVPPSSTIEICPGTYPEQLLITKPLTLKGLTFDNSSAPTITVPAGGLSVNITSVYDGMTAIAAQVAVNTDLASPSNVNINNIVIDGTNNGIQGCAPLFVGLYYGNTSGTISHVSAVNQILGQGLTGCQSGLAILAESGGGGASTVTISGNYVANYDKNGITTDGANTSATISGNTIIGVGPTTGAGQNSIQVGPGAASGTVSGNTVGGDVWAPDVFGDTGDAAAGILVYAAEHITVTGNTVAQTQYGIAYVSDSMLGAADGGTITSNKVSNTLLYDGIDLCNSSNKVQGNIITGSGESGIHIDDSCGSGDSNTISSNTINTACAGILAGPSTSGSTITGTTYINDVNNLLTGSDVCPVPPPASASVRAARARPRPFRP